MLLEKPVVYHVSKTVKRTLTNVSDLKFADSTGERINCTVVFAEFPMEPMPFTADKFDSMAHGREIYQDLLRGRFGAIAPYEGEDPWSE